jgi:hypothetical protein
MSNAVIASDSEAIQTGPELAAPLDCFPALAMTEGPDIGECA